jgi:hypothetical protein
LDHGEEMNKTLTVCISEKRQFIFTNISVFVFFVIEEKNIKSLGVNCVPGNESKISKIN